MSTPLPTVPVNKRLAIVGGALLALGAGGGIAAAQGVEVVGAAKPSAGTVFQLLDPKELEAQQQKFQQALASRLGVSVERLTQALAEARKEAGLPEVGAPGAVAFAPAARAKPLAVDPLATAAKTLSLSVEQLREELKTKSLADLARARGVDPNAVATAMKNEERSWLDQAAGKGEIPREVADRLKASLDERIDRLLNTRLGQPSGDFIFACGVGLGP